MPATPKRQQPWKTKLTPGKQYPIDDALKLVKEFATAKFAEAVDVAVNLGIDASKSDQQVRGSTVLPHGIGKSVRVAVFTSGKNQEAARAAGADIVGLEDLAEKVKAGQFDFDVVIASPDAMRVVGQLGQILGPRGLMPNPKVGTVTPDVAQAVRNAKAGQVQFRVDKAGIVHRILLARRELGLPRLHALGSGWHVRSPPHRRPCCARYRRWCARPLRGPPRSGRESWPWPLPRSACG